jgi:hypothetical protein
VNELPGDLLGVNAPHEGRSRSLALLNGRRQSDGAVHRAALIYQHKSSPADRQIADGLDALLRASRDRRTDDGTTGALAPVS